MYGWKGGYVEFWDSFQEGKKNLNSVQSNKIISISQWEQGFKNLHGIVNFVKLFSCVFLFMIFFAKTSYKIVDTICW